MAEIEWLDIDGVDWMRDELTDGVKRIGRRGGKGGAVYVAWAIRSRMHSWVAVVTLGDMGKQSPIDAFTPCVDMASAQATAMHLAESDASRFAR